MGWKPVPQKETPRASLGANRKEKPMSSENETWESVKKNYLGQVEAALKSANFSRTHDILEDVGGHLEQKFAELSESERTWENFQKIITEMGPASDYVELLGEKAVIGGGEKGIWGRFAVNAAMSILIIAAIIVMVQVVDWLAAPYYGKRVAVGEPNKPGEFAVSTFKTLQGRYVDKIKYPFVDDPDVIGRWVTVDYVNGPDEFSPGQKRWPWDLWLKGITFYKGGTTNWAWQWTKGLLIQPYSKTASRYRIKTIDGQQYMFFEWKSGDYTILHRKPEYYVLKKEAGNSAEKSDATLPPAQVDANGNFIVETSTNEQDRFVDRLNYPFINDAQVIGKWISVDFVQKPEDFTAGEQHWPGDLYLKNLYFFEGGTTGGPWTWTKGLVLHPGDNTAARYTIKTIDGQQYMFFEWKSGDYVIRHRKPEYYVLKSADSHKKSKTDKHDQDVVDGITAARGWLAIIDNGDYGKSWDEAADFLKGAVKKADLEKSFEAVRKPLGAVKSREANSAMYTKAVPGAPDGQYVVIQFKTVFENKEEAVETVTPMLDNDGKWRVSGYYIK